MSIWVDWQFAYPTEAHAEFLRAHYLHHTRFGECIRDTQRRIGDLGLEGIEFGGGTVIDLGCNGGQFLNYAAARYGLGLDWPETARCGLRLQLSRPLQPRLPRRRPA